MDGTEIIVIILYLALYLGVILGIVALAAMIWRRVNQPKAPSELPTSALELLEGRFASGEIDAPEFEARATVLRRSHDLERESRRLSKLPNQRRSGPFG